MTDRESFIAAIRANPDDDTLRLVFADWLQEQGEDDRAEFIRAQVEFDRHPLRHEVAARNYEVRARRRQEWDQAFWLHERQLFLISFHPEWRPVCPACSGQGWTPFPDPAGGSSLRNVCSYCNGDGRLIRANGLHRFDRGFLNSVPVPALATVLIHETEDDGAVFPGSDQQIQIYTGRWRPTEYARNLLRDHPLLTRIKPRDLVDNVFTDEGVAHDGVNNYGWWDEAGTATGNEGNVPTIIFDAMWATAGKNSKRQDDTGRWLVWLTLKEAVDELAIAVCDVVHKLCREE